MNQAKAVAKQTITMQEGTTLIRVELEECDRKVLRKKRTNLQESLEKKLTSLLCLPPEENNLEKFNELLYDPEWNELRDLVDKMKTWDIVTTIPEPKSFLNSTRFYLTLADMLANIVQYERYLKLVIVRFEAENELIAPNQSTAKDSTARNTKGQHCSGNIDAPIHYAAMQLSQSFLEWLLERPKLDVNLRNSDKKTALAILCEKFDQLKICLKAWDEAKVQKLMNDLLAGGADYNAYSVKLKKQHEVFFEWLLQRPDTIRQLQNKEREATKEILCQQYAEFKHIVQSTLLPTAQAMIKRLLKAGADFNICDIKLRLPIDMLLRHRESGSDGHPFVDECIQQAGYALVVITSDRVLRTVGFLDNNPNIRLTVELFEIFLRYNDVANFQEHWPRFIITEDNVKKVIRLLLHTTLDQNLPDSFRTIVNAGDKLIFKLVDKEMKGRRRKMEDQRGLMTDQRSNEMENRVELKGLLKKACEKADLSVLKLLLPKITDLILLNDDPLLAITLNKTNMAKRYSEKRLAFLACAEFLADTQTVYMTKVDDSGNTPLHLALKYGFDTVALALMKQRYAYLGLRNRENLTPLDYGTCEFWRSYLDRCIEVETDRGKDQPMVRFNLNCFEPFKYGKSAASANQKGHTRAKPWRIVQDATTVKYQPRRYVQTVTEMTTVRQIAQSKELKTLLIHPLVHTFIMVKWMRLNHWNYLNLLLTVLLALLFSGYSLTACSRDGPNPILLWSSMAGTMMLACREILQLLILRKSYFSFENILDIVNVVAMVVVFWHGCFALLSSLVVISLAMQVIFLLGSLPFNSLSTVMYMFKTVTVNFMKSFLLFIPLIGAFIYAFYLTYNESPEEVAARDACDDDDCAEKNFNSFHTIWNATIKTLVMTTGELDAATFDFADGKVLLFILFLFIAPIVIMNLINGLAVSDIAAIREESELISITKKVMLLEQYERGVANAWPTKIRSFFPKPFFAQHNCWVQVKAKEFRKIEVHPRNALGKLATGPGAIATGSQAATRKKHKSEFVPISVFPWVGNGCSNMLLNFRLFKLTLFMRLDQSILNEALAIYEKRHPFTGTTPNANALPDVKATTSTGSPAGTPSPTVTPTALFEQTQDVLQKELQDLKGQMKLMIELLLGKQKHTSTLHLKDKGIKRHAVRKRVRMAKRNKQPSDNQKTGT